MTLHELWEHVDAEALIYYEYMDHENECVRIAEYDEAERFTTGSSEVFSIKPYFMAGIGNVILATL